MGCGQADARRAERDGDASTATTAAGTRRGRVSTAVASFVRAAALVLGVVAAASACAPEDGDAGGEPDAVTPADGDTDGAGTPAGCASDEACSHLAAGPCQRAQCELSTAQCVLIPTGNGEPCDDGDPCTLAGTCSSGTCLTLPIECDDGDPCTDGICSQGACGFVYNDAPCDDGDPCTTESRCVQGTCVGQPTDCACVADSDCAELDDGDACTGVMRCLAGRCSIDPATIPSCEALGSACVVTSCIPETGDCELHPLDGGDPCDDGDPCTTATVCEAGECVPQFDGECSDGNPCTVDACELGVGCVHTPIADGAPCDDGDSCSEDPSCQQGACVPSVVLVCDDGDPCTTDTCQEGGGCVHTPYVGPCDDGDACTQGETCATGQCAGGGPVGCDDGDPCTVNSCSSVIGCLSNPRPEGSGCDDGDACTQGETCKSGVCTPMSVKSCDDGNPCTLDTCDSGGACVSAPVADGTPCDDGDVCTTQETCQGGLCVSDEPPCDPCQVGGDWTPCDDGNPSTFGDLCHLGSCLGFVRQQIAPTGLGDPGRLDAVTVQQQQVVALGRTPGAGDMTLSWGVELRGTLPPSVAATSIRVDGTYVDLSHGLAVTNQGKAAFVNGSSWDQTTGVNTALASLPAPAEVTSVWGTSLQNVPGNLRDAWLIAGRATSGGGWMVRCRRESAPGGSGFVWLCDPEVGLSASIGGVIGLHAWTGPCQSAGCAGLEILGALGAARASQGNANYVIELKSGSWATVGNVANQPADQWLALRGLGQTAWGVGTKGLVSASTAANWPPFTLLGGPEPADVNLTSVWVGAEWIWATATRQVVAFGKNTSETYLVAWPATGSGTTLSARWVKITTALCPDDLCQDGGNDAAAWLRGVAVGGLGGQFGVYLVGQERIGGVIQAVAYFRPL